MDRRAREYVARAPGRRNLKQDIARAATARLSGVPLHVGSREFVTWRTASGPGGAVQLTVRTSGDSGTGRVLVAPRQGFGFSVLGISPDGEKVVVGESAIGSNWMSGRVISAASGRIIDTLHGLVYRTQGSLVWSADGGGFHYLRTEPAPDVPQNPGRTVVTYHRLGAARELTCVIDSAVADGVLSLAGGGLNGQTLVILHTENATRRTTVAVASASGSDGVARTVRQEVAQYSVAGEIDGAVFLIEWSASTPTGRIVRVDSPLVSPRWREVVPGTGSTISSWPGSSAVVVDEQLLVGYTTADGDLAPNLVHPEGAVTRLIRLPARGSVWSGFSVIPGTPLVQYQLTGLADPGSTFRLDVRTGVSLRIANPPVGYDPSEFITERIEVVARDGARIPVDIVRHQQTPSTASAPLILYGYGFGGWNAAPWFQPMMAAWVRGGGRWAVAGLRGDGVRGESWHQAGVRERKVVGINDYVDAARGLIGMGLTQADQLVANASSAGGALVAAAVQQQPELFGAAVFDYAIFDMLRYERFGHGKQWTSEYGETADSAQFAALYQYSPVHRVPQDRCLPPILLAPGELDQTATPVHSYKFAAALLDRPARCRAPVLLRVTWGGGHNAGRTTADAIATWVDELSFLRRVIPAWPVNGTAR